VSTPHFLAYSSAKFAIVGFSDGLRTELRQSGIGVTTIIPGFMRTGAHYNATFKGDPLSEYEWFRTASLAPLLSTDADRAARRIVKAIRRDEREVVIGLQGTVTALAQRFTPSLTYAARLLMARYLPRPGKRLSSKGSELEGRLRGIPRLIPGRGVIERFRQVIKVQ
jgi:short-subunit dehydrogenase